MTFRPAFINERFVVAEERIQRASLPRWDSKRNRIVLELILGDIIDYKREHQFKIRTTLILIKVLPAIIYFQQKFKQRYYSPGNIGYDNAYKQFKTKVF